MKPERSRCEFWSGRLIPFSRAHVPNVRVNRTEAASPWTLVGALVVLYVKAWLVAVLWMCAALMTQWACWVSASSPSTPIKRWHIMRMLRSQKWKVHSCLGTPEHHTTILYTLHFKIINVSSLNVLKELTFIHMYVYICFWSWCLDHLSNVSTLKFKEPD